MADYQTGEMPTSGEPGYVQLTITGDYEIDWGDGTVTTNTKSHTYPTSNGTEYTVKIKGNIKSFRASSSYKSAICSCVTEVLTPLLSGISSFASVFAWTPLLRKVPSNLLKNYKGVEGVNASGMFNNSGIREIPQRLFSGVKGWLINDIFSYCKNLVTVPPNVFANATFNTTGKNTIFSNCTNLKYVYDYPAGISPNFTGTALEEVDCRFVGITTAENVFSEFRTLKRVGAELFRYSPDIVSAQKCFYGCTALEEIPEGLFDGLDKIVSFKECFRLCMKVNKLPNGLFKDSISANDFMYCFARCAIDSIPSDLFEGVGSGADFAYAFSQTAITSIPLDLFDGCATNSIFNNTFNGCSNVTSQVPDLWNYSSNGSNCYCDCNSAANYSDIPSMWK
jgi:hypothetical protein